MGRLTKEDKEAMAEYFSNKEQYDPAKDRKQDTADFMPQMCQGGEMGYADGGAVMEQGPEEQLIQGPVDELVQGQVDSIGPEKERRPGMVDPGPLGILQRMKPADMSAQPSMRPNGNGDSADSVLAALSPGMAAAQVPNDPGEGKRVMDLSIGSFEPKQFPFGAEQDRAKPIASAPAARPAINPADLGMYANAMRQDQPALPAQPAPLAAPASSGKLAPDQFEELIQALSKPPTAGQRASRGLAALADGIMSGVARAPSPGYAKNVEEQQQGQKEQLINALRAKYETGYKGQELQQAEERLTEEQRAHQADEKARQQALAEETRAHNLEASQRGAQLGYEQGKESREAQQANAKNQVDAAQKILDAYKNAGVIGHLGLGASPSRAEYEAAQKVIQNNGGIGGAAGPYGATTVRNGKTYQWNQATGKYHPVQ